MCCLVSAATNQRMQWHRSMEKCWIHEERENSNETWRKKICFSSFTMNPTESDKRFNRSYTVRRQHLSSQHEDSTIFIWNVHSKTVWTLYWYCIVHWYLHQCKILESIAINIQWVSRPPAPLVNTWQIFKKNIRYNLHCNCKNNNMSAGLPLLFSASAVSNNYNNYLLSSFESYVHGPYFRFIVWTI